MAHTVGAGAWLWFRVQHSKVLTCLLRCDRHPKVLCGGVVLGDDSVWGLMREACLHFQALKKVLCSAQPLFRAQLWASQTKLCCCETGQLVCADTLTRMWLRRQLVDFLICGAKSNCQADQSILRSKVSSLSWRKLVYYSQSWSDESCWIMRAADWPATCVAQAECEVFGPCSPHLLLLERWRHSLGKSL